jgi:NADPH2:quinone reductase
VPDVRHRLRRIERLTGRSDTLALQDIEIDVPELRPHDILVRVMAVSVNPVDVKRRQSLAASSTPTILGFDAAGVVEAVGTAVQTHSVGDEVWYAGDISRNGTNAEFHAVDERIVSRKPVSLSFAAAAALPLTTITAWESLFERFSLNAESTGDLLILGAAGGVGSIMIQLAKALTKVRVIATASRDESRDWAIQLGADAVIDHHNLVDEATHVAPNGIDYLFTPQTQGNGENFVKILRPFGQITAIDDPTDLDVTTLKAKSISWHWEFMFTRPLYGYDMVARQRLLARTAELVDSAVLRTTVTTTIEDFTAVGIRQAHSEIESGHAVGKVVVTR